MLINKLMSVFHASVQYIYFFITLSKYLWIDEAIAVWIDNVMTKFIVNNRTGARKTDVNLFFTITIIFQIVRSQLFFCFFLNC